MAPDVTHVQPRVQSPAGPDDEDDALSLWKAQYPMPEEKGTVSKPQAALKYRPPRSDWKGVSIACTVITLWTAVFYHGCWQIKLTGPDKSAWWDVVATFLALEFLNTGLFITTHDAMHGTIAIRNRRLNDLLGNIAISLYAWFDYDMLHKKHWEHHNFTGLPHKDPDFHRGDPALHKWFGRFMWEYATPLQFAKIFAYTFFLQSLRVQYPNLCVFLAAAPLVSAFRLFYFGTYLPHLPSNAQETMPWEKSHSADDPRPLSFLKCYHFDYHWEHHRWPYAPWWELPVCKRITKTLDAAVPGVQSDGTKKSQLVN
eukprot:jgi/Chrzof1/3917/Cz13g13100.t1_BKT1[v5.2]